MTDRALSPDHDALLFVLDCTYPAQCTALAADAIAAAADVAHPALGSGEREPVERWTLVVDADAVMWSDDAAEHARALAAHPAMTPEAARRFAQRIAPVLAGGALDGVMPRDTVAIVNAHGVPRAERDRLLTLGALAAPAARALRPPRAGEAPATLACIEPAGPHWPGVRFGLAAAAFDARGRSEPEARALAAGHRARLITRHAGVRPWLPGAPEATVTVRARDHHAPPSVVCAPFVVVDATPARALGANPHPEPMLELARRVVSPSLPHSEGDSRK